MSNKINGGKKSAPGAVKIALAGNPNCGKTTLFNALTGVHFFGIQVRLS